MKYVTKNETKCVFLLGESSDFKICQAICLYIIKFILKDTWETVDITNFLGAGLEIEGRLTLCCIPLYNVDTFLNHAYEFILFFKKFFVI